MLEEIAAEITQQLVLAHRSSTTRDPIEQVEEVAAKMRSIYAADGGLSSKTAEHGS